MVSGFAHVCTLLNNQALRDLEFCNCGDATPPFSDALICCHLKIPAHAAIPHENCPCLLRQCFSVIYDGKEESLATIHREGSATGALQIGEQVTVTTKSHNSTILLRQQ